MGRMQGTPLRGYPAKFAGGLETPPAKLRWGPQAPRPKCLPLLTRVSLGRCTDLDSRINHHLPPAGIRRRIIGALLSEQLAGQIILMPAGKDNQLPGVVV